METDDKSWREKNTKYFKIIIGVVVFIIICIVALSVGLGIHYDGKQSTSLNNESLPIIDDIVWTDAKVSMWNSPDFNNYVIGKPGLKLIIKTLNVEADGNGPLLCILNLDKLRSKILGKGQIKIGDYWSDDIQLDLYTQLAYSHCGGGKNFNAVISWASVDDNRYQKWLLDNNIKL